MAEGREYKYLGDLNYCTHFMGYVRVRILHKHAYPQSSVDMVLMDKKGTTINGKIHENSVKKFIGTLEEGRIYDIGRFRLTPADKPSRPTRHKKVLWINPNTQTDLIPEIQNFPLTRSLNFTPLHAAEKLLERKDCTFLHDLIGVVTVVTGIVRYDKFKMKREVTIQDRTGTSIKLTLWNKYAEEFDNLDISEKSVLVVSFASMNIFNNVGQGFTTSRFSNIAIDIDHPKTEELKKSDNYDAIKAGVKLDDWRNNEKITLIQAVDNLKPQNVEERYTVVGKLTHDETFLYKACPECKTKSPNDEVMFDCKKCQMKVSTQLYCRSSIYFMDSTATENVSLFGNQLETVLKMKLAKIIDAHNNNTLSNAFAAIKKDLFVVLLKPNVSGTTMYLSVTKIGRYIEPMDEVDDDFLDIEDSLNNESEDMVTNKDNETNFSPTTPTKGLQLSKNTLSRSRAGKKQSLNQRGINPNEETPILHSDSIDESGEQSGALTNNGVDNDVETQNKAAQKRRNLSTVNVPRKNVKTTRQLAATKINSESRNSEDESISEEADSDLDALKE